MNGFGYPQIQKGLTMKTIPTDSSVLEYLQSLPPGKRQDDGLAMLHFMSQLTQIPPRMWGGSIIGYGSYHYQHASGKEGDWFLAGFSPRKNQLAIYILPGLDLVADLLPRLGKCKTGQSCLYLPSLDQIDRSVLAQMIKRALNSCPQELVACP